MTLGKVRFSRTLIIYFSLALTLTSYHTLHINRRSYNERSEYHQDIIAGEAKSPYQYRVLAPFLTEAGGLALEKVLDLPSGRPRILAREVFYAGLRFIATFIALVVFHKYLMTWFSSEIALSGTILLAGMHVYTFRHYFYQPSSSLYLMFLTVGTYLIVRGYTGWLYPLIFFASLSRETSGILVALFIAAHWPLTRRNLLNVFGIFASWLSAQIIVRLLFTNVESVLTRPLHENFHYFNLLWPIFLFGLFWLIPIIRYRILPPFMRYALLLVLPPVILVNFMWGKVEESRLFLDLAIVLIPSTFYVLFEAKADAVPETEIA